MAMNKISKSQGMLRTILKTISAPQINILVQIG